MVGENHPEGRRTERRQAALMKRLLAFVAVVALCLAVAALHPSQGLMGWLRGESFFSGRPAGYWRDVLISDDPLAREEARQQLVAGGSESTAVLVELLRASAGSEWDSAEVRWTSAEVLSEIGPAAGEAGGAALLAALDDPDPHVRAVSAKGLPAVGVPAEQAVPALVRLLQKEPTVVVVYALSEYGPDAAPSLERLVPILTNKELDTELRWNAARTLGKLREAGVDAIPVLVDSLADEAATVREHSAEALGDIGAPAKSAVPALIAVLADPATRVRRDAARSLGQIAPPADEAVPELKKLLKDPEAIVRDAALTAIRSLAPNEPLELEEPHVATGGTLPVQGGSATP
jgi:HEAT repeat protein